MNEKNYPCELIEDILPLYIENEVSEKTKEIVTEHLAQCDECSKLTDELTNSANPVSFKELKESLPEAYTFKSWLKRLKSLAFKILAIILVTVLAVGGISYYAGKNRSMERHLVYAKEKQDINRYFYEKTPGLQRAEAQGSVYKIGEKVQIPEGKGELVIDKVWYSSKDTYVFYHISGELPTDTSATLYWNSNSFAPHVLHNMSVGEGVIYQGSFYSRFTFNNMGRQLPTEKTDEYLKLEATVRYGEKAIFPPAVPFSVSFDPGLEKIYTYGINQTLTLGQKGNITFHQLIIEPQDCYITFEFANEQQDELANFVGTMTTNQGEKRSFTYASRIEGQKASFYKARLDPLESIPDTLSIQIDGINLVTEYKVNFEIPVKHLHGKFTNPGKEEILDKKIGTFEDATLLLHSLYWDDRGLDFSILQKYKMPRNSPFNNITMPMMSEIWHVQDSMKYSKMDIRFPNVLDITNEKGVQAKREHYGQRGGGPGDRADMFIDKAYVESSDTLYVSLSNISHKEYGPWKTEIEVR